MYHELDDAVRNMIRRVSLVDLDDSGPQQNTRLKGLSGEELKKVVRVQPYGFTSNPPAGSEGLLLSMGGRSDRAMVLGIEAPGKRPTALGDGATAIYGPDGSILKMVMQSVTLDAGGKEVVITNAKKVTIKATDEVVLSANDQRFIRLRPGRVDLAVKSASEDAPQKVMTLGGPSDVVWARLD